MTPNLSSEAAGLWWLSLAEVPDEAWDRWMTVLDDEESARAARFVQEPDRHQFIAAHALLRVLLQHFGGHPAETWRFASHSHGKPSLHGDHRLPRLSFNISHTRGAVACAITLDHAIGVDIEHIERSARFLELARSYFAPAEIALLRAAPSAAQRPLFFRLWTLKEAYIKAHGDGLSVPLDQFAFSLSPLRVVFTAAIPEDPALWQFCTFTPTLTHVLSLAIRRGTNSIAVTRHRVTPSDIDRMMAAAPGSQPSSVSR